MDPPSARGSASLPCGCTDQTSPLLPADHTTALFPDAGSLLPVRPGEGSLLDV